MTMVGTVRDAAFVLAVLVMGVLPASGQTSVGFEEPEDTTNLLEYRLPDWGYRTWNLDFDLTGGGREVYVEDRMAVVASVSGENRQQYLESAQPSNSDNYNRSWSWAYGLGLEYRLDSFLY